MSYFVVYDKSAIVTKQLKSSCLNFSAINCKRDDEIGRSPYRVLKLKCAGFRLCNLVYGAKM